MPKAKAHMEVKPSSQAIHVYLRFFWKPIHIPAHHWHPGRLNVLTCVLGWAVVLRARASWAFWE